MRIQKYKTVMSFRGGGEVTTILARAIRHREILPACTGLVQHDIRLLFPTVVSSQLCNLSQYYTILPFYLHFSVRSVIVIDRKLPQGEGKEKGSETK